MIVVTGATGALNGATVEHLLQRVPADQVGVSARDVTKARHFAERGVRVRQGSYDDPEALRDSFTGADQVLLVSSSDPTADVVGQHRTAIRAAVAAGARRILYTSTVGAAADAPYPRSPSTPPPRRCSPTPESPGPRCATASSATSTGSSALGGGPA
ncbi:NAD(P)H-binding protein [Saccharopolyspora sp. CA-218241]|uniref:NAD(P)H-binding protein n=1 Tax=Saccharopolyspora sp. CA-218241 TaxID=3240027 RepID=UPI003D98DBF5